MITATRTIIILIALQCTGAAFSLWISQTKMYNIVNTPFLQWHDANKHCQKLGMNLLSIKSKEEFDSLKEYIKNKHGRIYPYWIGAFKQHGVWKWLAYNEEIEAEQMMWHTGEPNDKSTNELCIHTWEGDFDWNDNDCERELPFICELQLDVLPRVEKQVN